MPFVIRCLIVLITRDLKAYDMYCQYFALTLCCWCIRVDRTGKVSRANALEPCAQLCHHSKAEGWMISEAFGCGPQAKFKVFVWPIGYIII